MVVVNTKVDANIPHSFPPNNSHQSNDAAVIVSFLGIVGQPLISLSVAKVRVNFARVSRRYSFAIIGCFITTEVIVAADKQLV